MRICGVLVRGPLGIGSAGIRILSPLDASHVIVALPSRWSAAARLSPGWPSGRQRGIHLPSSCCLSLSPENGVHIAHLVDPTGRGGRTDGRTDGRPRACGPLPPSNPPPRPPLLLLMMIDLGLASASTTSSASDLSDCFFSRYRSSSATI